MADFFVVAFISFFLLYALTPFLLVVFNFVFPVYAVTRFIVVFFNSLFLADIFNCFFVVAFIYFASVYVPSSLLEIYSCRRACSLISCCIA